MWINSTTPGPSSAAVRFRADRVLAVKGPPYETASPWSELLFVGGAETLVVAEDPDTLSERISGTIDAMRRSAG